MPAFKWFQAHVFGSRPAVRPPRTTPASSGLFSRMALLGWAIFAAGNACAQAPASPCPPIGADTTCGIIITVVKTSNAACPAQGCAAITFTGQGPYDRIEDTLVGVVNSGGPGDSSISSMILKSSTDAFGFDGDGVCGLDPNTGAPFVPAPAGCSFGPTGYEGPGVSFSNIGANATTGTVNFNPPIPPGGTAYFSLEESLTQATACSSVINGAVPKPAGGGTSISATFTPNLGFTLAQAAQICGFTAWNWQQTVTEDPCADVFEVGSATPLKAPPPYNDPPLNGYSYQHPPNAVHLPVYYNMFTAATDPLSLAFNETATTLTFGDAPADQCLSGSNNGTGKRLAFTTHLVGLVGLLPGAAVQDTGIGFSYIDTFNGTSGGISVRNGFQPVDPGSGTGGITITAYNGTSSYQFPKGLGVAAINGVANGTGSGASSTLFGQDQIAVTASGLAYSRVSRTFNGTVSIKNVSAATVNGPFQIVLDSLTPGVTVSNSAGNFGGWPYVTIPSVGNLAPGQSASVTVMFQNPANGAISFAPVSYSGSFN